MRFALDRVTLTYADRREPALREVSLAIETGERVALMGASGSGKSTLLRLLAGLETPDAGRVLIDGIDVGQRSPPERGVGMVLQDAPLYEHLSVLDNVAHPLRARGESTTGARASAEAALSRVQLAEMASARGSQLSGGERRRVALARALVTRPALLLLDEPFGSLDPALRMELRDEVRRLTIEIGCACVHATHDGLEALALGTRVVVLDEGRVIDDGRPEDLWSQPRSPRSALLLGAVPMNIVIGHGATRALGIRPEQLRVTAVAPGHARAEAPESVGWTATGTLESIDSLGDRLLAVIRLLHGQCVRAMFDHTDGVDSAFAIGDHVQVSAGAEALHYFDDRVRSITG